ncbi:TM2 domain-containing protein [Flammeovirgaceae bacterium SG7u.111]|nr:TM2 domain-containing protein [Flammeovirgaceae bacterium SG7u.132]WPO36703.1 TM2 domain-containing protein [Flammeovirgaceae bacterium SG7u.111]
MNRKLLTRLPQAESEEMLNLEIATRDLSDEQVDTFIHIYKAKRKEPQTILLLNLLAIVGVGGIHRFLLNQVGMGILYLLTGGLCLIGTIIDAINYKKLTNDYNEKMMMETLSIVERSF